MKKRLIIVLLCFLFPLTANAGNVMVTDAENVKITQNTIVITRKQNDSQANDVLQPEVGGQTADNGTPGQGSASTVAASATLENSPNNQQSEKTNLQNAELAKENANTETNEQASTAPAEQPALAEETASAESSTGSGTSDQPAETKPQNEKSATSTSATATENPETEESEDEGDAHTPDIEQLRMDAKKIVDAYIGTKKQIEAKLKQSNQ